jgi:hypothetical protein
MLMTEFVAAAEAEVEVEAEAKAEAMEADDTGRAIRREM